MPAARPAPRKYIATVRQSLEELDTIAEKAKGIRSRLAGQSPKVSELNATLHEIEVIAYRTALELSKMKVADSCEDCPAAPAVTESDVRLVMVTQQLKQLADFARSATEIEPSQRSEF